MPPKKDKSRQTTVELDSPEENGVETGGELMPTTPHRAVDRSMVPGIPQPQLETLMSIMNGMLDQRRQRFEQRLERIEEQLDLLPSTETPEPEASPPRNPPSNTVPPQLRA